MIATGSGEMGIYPVCWDMTEWSTEPINGTGKAARAPVNIPCKSFVQKHLFNESPSFEVKDAVWQKTERPENPIARPERNRPLGPGNIAAYFEPLENSRIAANTAARSGDILDRKGVINPDIT